MDTRYEDDGAHRVPVIVDGTLVYSKTPRGIAEISLRSAQLPMRTRRILIMIDGKRTVDDLSILAKPGEIESAISSLESGGLIQRVSYQGAIDVPTINGRDSDAGFSSGFGGPSTSGGLDERDPSPITLEEVKRIESCRTIEEFRYRVREAERLISTALGASAAQEYLKALRRG